MKIYKSEDELKDIASKVSEEQKKREDDDYRWIDSYLKDIKTKVMLNGWELIREDKIKNCNTGAAYRQYISNNLRVIISGALEEDNKRWIHVSVSREYGLPNWSDLTLVKNLFIGEDKTAIQVFPSKDKYVNIADVLHIWYCYDGIDFIPDFTRGTGSI